MKFFNFSTDSQQETVEKEEDPQFKPEIFRLTPDEFLEKRRNSTRAYIFDLRSQGDYDTGHLPGAHSLPSEHFEDHLYKMPYQGDIMLYGKTQEESETAGQFLYDNGFDSFSYTNSYDELSQALLESKDEIKLQELPEEQRIPVIEEVLDKKIRPALASDGGGLSVLNIDGNQVFVEYHGACGNCPSSTTGTLKFIESQLTVSLNHDMQVIPA